MKKPDIAKRMARQAGVSHAEAADRLDNVVRQILSDLKRGRDSAFPGLGRFRHGADGKVVFEPEAGGSRRG
jgi:nucleoid DNA-binding protein